MSEMLTLTLSNMNACIKNFTVLILLARIAFAQIADPVVHFKNTSSDPAAKLIKWTADINGDGQSEVFISNKEDYDNDLDSEIAAGWFVFFALQGGGAFIESVGVREADGDSIGVGVLAAIDLKICFVGYVSELNKCAIITQQMDNPRVGESVARIYAYTIEGDHLARAKLAEYNPTHVNALFDKYLKDGKRTVITPVVVAE